jgi:glyoxylase-like metal-dependent hydrolase (beta-lactamase superfamily II)
LIKSLRHDLAAAAGRLPDHQRAAARDTVGDVGTELTTASEGSRVDMVNGAADLVNGVTLLPAPGHTPHHQCVLLGQGADRALFLADLCPTSAHLPLPWIMGYDLEPLVTLESKRSILGKAREEGWVLIFQHDAKVPWGRLEERSERFHLQTVGNPISEG